MRVLHLILLRRVLGLSRIRARTTTAPKAARLSAQWPPAEPQPQVRNAFGSKAYWDAMYADRGDLDGAEYAWFCGWAELAPFWDELVPRGGRVLVPGCGNDPTLAAMYDAGHSDLTAFDYSAGAVGAQKALLGPGRGGVVLETADARDLPFGDGAFDAVLDKGTLDVLDMAGHLDAGVAELRRVCAPGAIVVCCSRVVDRDVLLASFRDAAWEPLRDGSLAFTEDGSATIDLGADLYAWRRRRGA